MNTDPSSVSIFLFVRHKRVYHTCVLADCACVLEGVRRGGVGCQETVPVEGVYVGF